MTHKVLDLFSGIGGFSLGLQNTGGFETVAFCEIEPYCHKVLNKHWKDVPIYNDIKELTYDTLQADGIEPDVITGGFPCQDISVAGKQKGIIGERSSLWSEYARLIEDVRPKWAIIENVPTLRSKGLTLVLQNLSEIGYHAEWHCIPCSAIGGLHRRDRIWIIAYPLANSRCTFGQGSIIEGENANEVGEGNANQYQRSSSTPGNDTGTQGSEEGIVANSNTRHGNNEEEEVRTGREAIDSSSYGERGGGKETVENPNNYGLEGGRSETRNQTSSGENPKENRRDYSDNTSRSSNDRGDSKESSVNGTLQGSSNGYKTEPTTSTGLCRVSEESDNGKRVSTENRNQENNSRTLVQERQARIQSSNDRGLGEDQTSFTGSEVRSGDDEVGGDRMATEEENVVNSNGIRCQHDKESKKASSWRRSETSTSTTSSDVSNSMCEGLEGSEFSSDNSGQDEQGSKSSYGSASKPSGIRREPELIVSRGQLERYTDYAKTQWAIEPNVGRVAYGIPRRVDRLRGLGNAVLPQIPQFLGECILNFEKENI